MSTEMQVQTQEEVAAGFSRSEPVGRAQRNASGRDVGIHPGVGDLPDRVKALLPDEVLDELLAGAQGEQEIVGPGGLLSQLTKRLVERAMEVELTDHLGYEPHGGTPWDRSGCCESFDDLVEWVEGAIACRDAGIRRSRSSGS